MSTHKHIDKICVAAIVISLIISVLFMNGSALGIQAAGKTFGYEERLFSTDKVHTIDIVIDDWNSFLSTAQGEEYSVCSVVIDGEAINNVGIRGKGNTSLSTVSSMNSDRYSFKIEFDQYDDTKSYHGLDKLCLNNLIQDNTYMKDYLTYQMMGEFGVASPLCSYAYITVNGEDWGLYLAVEAIEESFLQRNYGSNYGDLYKPDSMSFGGGRGNGKDFDMSAFRDQQEAGDSSDTSNSMPNNMPGRGNNGAMTPPDGFGSKASGTTDEDKNFPNNMMGGFGNFDFSIDEETVRNVFEELGLDDSVLDGLDFDNLTLEDIQEALSDFDEETMQSIVEALMGSGNMEMPDMGGFGGMGSSDVKLQYIDDDPDSYANIFDSAKTNVTEADQNRLIESLKHLSEYENIDEVVNIEDVLRYFVVHNFVVNGDSYTGSMIHNYYLYEENGQMSMLPWDYNLAFGTFQGGNASSSVNDDIDEALSDRPMQAWIFSDDSYSQQYYELYSKMLEQIDISGIIDNAYALITPYVEKDPTAFCTVDEFKSGVETLKEFCSLRAESVSLQLSGSSDTVDTGDLNLSKMGTMGNGMGGFGGRGDFGKNDFSDKENSDSSNLNTIEKNDTAGITQLSQSSKSNASGVMKLSQDMQRPEGMEMPEGMQVPEGMEMPEGMQPPEGMEMPEGMQLPEGMELPDGAESAKDENSSDNNSQKSETEEAENNSNDTVKEKEDNSDDFQSNGMTDFGNRGEWSEMTPNGQSSTSTVTNMVYLAVSVLFLGIGLFVAFKFKR